jgi:hypothetical protein
LVKAGGIRTSTIAISGRSLPAGHPAQPAAAGQAGPAFAVVADRHRQRAAGVGQLDRGLVRAGVLDHVGQALADREVDRRRHRRGELAADRDRDGQVEGERADRPLQAAVGQHRRRDPPHERAQVVQGGQRRGARRGQQLGQQARVPVQQVFG